MAGEVGANAPVYVADDKADGAVLEDGARQAGERVQVPLPRSKYAHWHRSTLFSVMLAGLISFTQPGIWNALNSVCASQILSHFITNDSHRHGVLAVSRSRISSMERTLSRSVSQRLAAPSSAPWPTKFGLKAILVVGTLRYALYSASLYTNNRYEVERFVFVWRTKLC